MLRKLLLPLFLLAGSLAFLAAPDTRIAAAGCGDTGNSICSTEVTCISCLWFTSCATTSVSYWPER
jgi:hypothetical protein